MDLSTAAREPVAMTWALPDVVDLPSGTAAPTPALTLLTATRPTSRADAVLADLLLPQFSSFTETNTLALLGSDDLQRRLDALQDALRAKADAQQALLASGLVLGGGLSVGYVVWLVRGGVLASSMLSALPAWQMVDPLPVLAAARRDRPGQFAADDGDRNIERLFDRRQPRPASASLQSPTPTPADTPPQPTAAAATTAPEVPA